MKSKRIISLLVGIFLLFSIPVTIFLVRERQELRKKAAPATSLEVKPATESVKVGDVFTKTIAIDTGENTVSAAVVEVLFDNTKLKATKIEAGDFITEILQAGVIREDKASITLGSGPGKQKKGSGTLAKVTFQALAGGENIRILLGPATKAAGIDESTDVLTTRGAFGTVTITSDSLEPTATPTPTNTLTPTPTPYQGGETTFLTLQKPSDGSVVQTNRPIFQGTASPGSTITIVIFSEPITGVVVADAQGRFSYTPTVALAEGVHTVQITEQRLDGTTKMIVATIIVQTTKPIPVTGGVGATIGIISLGVGILLMGVAGIPFAYYR